MQTHQIVLFVCIGLGMFAVIGGLALLSNYYTLNGIKSRTVGDGQHGTARFATEKEIRETYAHIPYQPEKWRKGESLPAEQGLVVGYKKKGGAVTALVDSGDIHCLMIGASGIRILVDSQVDYGKNRNQALTAVIFVTGLSGIKVNFGNVQLTGMVLACVTGMILSLVFYVFDKLKLTNDQ